jgi:hypothetical protein
MNDKLLYSFGALYALLERPKAARRTVIGLLAVHTCLLAFSACVHSPTLNEPAHLAAGLSHWEFGRFDLYRVNPPLVRMVATLPILAMSYEDDWSRFYEGPGARPEFVMGDDLIRANRERSLVLCMIARWACIPFSWLGAIICYLWARDLGSRTAGVIACAIWCFEPNILAHAALMTPDVGGTALGVAACYTFWLWLRHPGWKQAALTGVVLGLAELCKTTLILFYPLWPVLWILYRFPSRAEKSFNDWMREAGMLAMRMLIGLYILNLGYLFEGTCTQLRDYQFTSDLFSGIALNQSKPGNVGNVSSKPIDEREMKKLRPRREQFGNRFAESWLGSLPVPLPKNFLLGIDTQQFDFEHYGERSYLRGRWQRNGWWYYYLYAAAIKVPLALWVSALLLVIHSIFTRSKTPLFNQKEHIHATKLDWLVLLAPAIIIFLIVSSKTGFSEHFRYVLPCFPYLFIALGIAGGSFILKGPACTSYDENIPEKTSLHSRMRIICFRAPAFTFLMLWFFTSSLWIFPHHLSYFNELIGGPLSGPKHLLGSNVDWGQDLLYAAEQSQDFSADGCATIVNFSMYEPKDLGIKAVTKIPSQNASLASFQDCQNLMLMASNNILLRFLHKTTGREENLHFFQVWRDSTPRSYAMRTFASP